MIPHVLALKALEEKWRGKQRVNSMLSKRHTDGELRGIALGQAYVYQACADELSALVQQMEAEPEPVDTRTLKERISDEVCWTFVEHRGNSKGTICLTREQALKIKAFLEQPWQASDAPDTPMSLEGAATPSRKNAPDEQADGIRRGAATDQGTPQADAVASAAYEARTPIQEEARGVAARQPKGQLVGEVISDDNNRWNKLALAEAEAERSPTPLRTSADSDGGRNTDGDRSTPVKDASDEV